MRTRFTGRVAVREPMGNQLADGLAKSVPLRRLGTTDVSPTWLFLASEESS